MSNLECEICCKSSRVGTQLGYRNPRVPKPPKNQRRPFQNLPQPPKNLSWGCFLLGGVGGLGLFWTPWVSISLARTVAFPRESWVLVRFRPDSGMKLSFDFDFGFKYSWATSQGRKNVWLTFGWCFCVCYSRFKRWGCSWGGPGPPVPADLGGSEGSGPE